MRECCQISADRFNIKLYLEDSGGRAYLPMLVGSISNLEQIVESPERYRELADWILIPFCRMIKEECGQASFVVNKEFCGVDTQLFVDDSIKALLKGLRDLCEFEGYSGVLALFPITEKELSEIKKDLQFLGGQEWRT